MADASIKWERERDPLYTRLSERNNKRLSTFYSFLPGDGETNADYCLSPSSAPLSERYFTRGDIRPAPHLNALRRKNTIYSRRTEAARIWGRMMAIYSSCCATLLHQWTFIHPEWREEQKEERKKRGWFTPEILLLLLLLRVYGCRAVVSVSNPKRRKKGATLCFRSSFDEKDSVCLWYA